MRVSQMNDEKTSKLKILLAEDDASMRRFLQVALQKSGYETTLAEDGLAAMKIALTEKFDAVVTDAVMPNLTGHDLCRMLRQNPDFKNVALLILSGLEHEAAVNAENECADAFLVKGANIKEELPAMLDRLLGEKSKSA